MSCSFLEHSNKNLEAVKVFEVILAILMQTPDIKMKIEKIVRCEHKKS